ncbi:hypothetical protein PsorP6_009448 [Peronosclerospora sorghi]|uniref:Uncharacterized protein n=1 Tax=Peronosclerospora sorghi TaxID=230839 RepID=A0ACC0VYG0_9STRA|nr:hypothetical protein PsorP6_009448 [Peronosclerospora sorghi]
MEVADLSKVSDQLDNGYAQSKGVSEKMCHEATQRGLPVPILRPGNMSPSSFTGRGCVNLGSVPDRSDWFFDMTPVDYAARSIVHFSASRPVEALGQTLHIQNPSLPVKSDDFFAYFTAAIASKKLATTAFTEWSAVCSKSDKVFDSTLSSELLQAAGISYPSVNKELLVTYTAQW